MRKRRKWKLYSFPIKKEYVDKIHFINEITHHSGLNNVYSAIDLYLDYVCSVSGIDYERK